MLWISGLLIYIQIRPSLLKYFQVSIEKNDSLLNNSSLWVLASFIVKRRGYFDLLIPPKLCLIFGGTSNLSVFNLRKSHTGLSFTEMPTVIMLALINEQINSSFIPDDSCASFSISFCFIRFFIATVSCCT